MKVVLDEKTKAEEIIETNEIYENYKKTSFILIKYWHLVDNLKRGKIVEKLENFLEKNYKDFNPTSTMDDVEKMVDNYLRRKTPFNNVQSVKITKSELEYIRAFDDINAEKIAFVLLVRCKIEKHRKYYEHNWINFYEKEIYKQAKVQGTYKRKHLYTHRIEDGDIIKKSYGKDGIKIDFVDDSSEVVIEIADFRDFVYEYLRWRGENVGKCQRCEILFRNAMNNRIYCKACADEVNRESTKERMRKRRNV